MIVKIKTLEDVQRSFELIEKEYVQKKDASPKTMAHNEDTLTSQLRNILSEGEYPRTIKDTDTGNYHLLFMRDGKVFRIAATEIT
jgi:hypothetical protein